MAEKIKPWTELSRVPFHCIYNKCTSVFVPRGNEFKKKYLKSCFRSCENIVDIDDIGEMPAKEELLADIKQADRSVQYLLKKRKEDLSRVKKATANSLASVRNFREWVNNRLDELEKNTVEEINNFCIEEDDKIVKDTKVLEKQNVLLKFSLESLTTENTERGMVHLVKTHGTKWTLAECKQVCKEIVQTTKADQNEFQLNPMIQKYLSNLKSFGQFLRRGSGFRRSLIKIKTHTLRHDTTQTDGEPHFISVAALHDGNIAITDSNSKSLQILSKEFEVVNTVQIEELKVKANETAPTKTPTNEPYAVCVVDQTRVAVALEHDKRVLIINVKDMQTAEAKCIEMDEYCRGIEYDKQYGELYMCCGGGAFLGEGLGQLKIIDISTGGLFSDFEIPYIIPSKLLRIHRKSLGVIILNCQNMHTQYFVCLWTWQCWYGLSV